MPYTFAETDSKSGYGAGITFPAFYANVWKRMCKNENNVYEKCILEYIIKTARSVRKSHPVALPDEVEAFYMAQELAKLRGRNSAGVFELIDGVRSAFVKGDINSTAVYELDFLYKNLTGLGTGSVKFSGENDGIQLVPPAVIDFREQCKKFKIKTETVVMQNMTLNVVKKQNHYEKSCFMHRMQFLETGFCKLLKGPDYSTGKDINLLNEQWEMRYSTAVETKLIDLSVFGATVEQICLYQIKQSFDTVVKANEMGQLLLSTYMTGFSQTISESIPDFNKRLTEDDDFLSQCEFLRSMTRLTTLQKLIYGHVEAAVINLIEISYNTALNQFQTVRLQGGDYEDNICNGIRLLFSYTSDFPDICSDEKLQYELNSAAVAGASTPQVYGVCIALCYKMKMIDTDTYCDAINGYLMTSDVESCADFISGIILTGRDILMKNEMILKSIDATISHMDDKQFNELLPELRRAFTVFLPSETDRISRSVSELYNAPEDDLCGSYYFSMDEIKNARDAEVRSHEIMQKWGLI